MHERSLLLEPAVVTRVLRSRSIKEWEVFLGSVLAGSERVRLRELWPELDHPADLVVLLETDPEWQHVAHLVSLVRGDGKLIGEEPV